MKVTLGKKNTRTGGKTIRNAAQTAQADDKSQKDNMNIASGSLREIVGKRKRSSKFYSFGNGSMMTEIHEKPIHYYDQADKTFKDIDNRLVETEDGYKTNAGAFNTKFKRHSKDGSIFEMENGKCKVGLISLDAAAKGGCGLEVCECSESEAQKESKLMLKNVKYGVDFEYIVDSERVKENIIINEKMDNYEFDFELAIEGVTVGVSSDGKNLELIKIETGRPQFLIPAPFMTDAKHAYSDSVYYEIVQETPDKVSLKVIADKEWINAEERAFPVTIDPVIANVSYEGHGYYYDSEANGTKLFHYKTIHNGQQIGDALRIYYYGEAYVQSNSIESDLIIAKSKIDSYILKNIIEVSLEVRLADQGIIGDFSIDNQYFTELGDNITELLTVDITNTFLKSTGDVIIPFRNTQNRGNPQDTDLIFYKPCLKIKYANQIKSIEVTTPPAKTKYWPSDVFEPEEMIVTGTYENGDKHEIFVYEVFPSAPITLASYNDKDQKGIEIIVKDIDKVISTTYYGITVEQKGFDDRRPKENREGMYKIWEVNLDGEKTDGEIIPKDKTIYIKLELFDGADKDEWGTPLNATNLNNNLVVKAENIRGVIDEANLPEHLRQNNNGE